MTTHAQNLMKGVQEYRENLSTSSSFTTSWDSIFPNLSDHVAHTENALASSLTECTTLYGMPIFSRVTGKAATIGVIIVSNDRLYGITVCHSVVESPENIPEMTSEATQSARSLNPLSLPFAAESSITTDNHDDPEFAFDSEEEVDEYLGELNSFDATITSQGT